jgi:hypothetical protein
VGFDAWFARALDRDPEKRFQTAADLVEMLETLLARAPDDEADLEEPTQRNLLVERLAFDTFPGAPPERRSEVRVPSSIPAGLNRQRDLRHTALIHNASRTGALLATRQICELNQELVLTLHLKGPDSGEDISARVVRVTRLSGTMWRFEVGVQFETPLSDAALHEIEQRAMARGLDDD